MLSLQSDTIQAKKTIMVQSPNNNKQNRENNPLNPKSNLEDEATLSLRPETLKEFIGQDNLKKNLELALSSAKKRQEALDHILFFGPPGLGKTTLAKIVAREIGANFRQTAGSVLTRAGDLAAILTSLQPKDVFFIDEIHRLPAAVEEILYPAMEDFQIDLVIGEGVSARSVRLPLKPFTLIGATTRAGLIARPLRDRFGMLLHTEFYAVADLAIIVKRLAELHAILLSDDTAKAIATRSRGTPRIAVRLMNRLRDYAVVHGKNQLQPNLALRALAELHIDDLGLDDMDRKYLTAIAKHYTGGPVGVDNIASVLGQERDVLEEVIEPFLMQQGFIQRTSRGRVLTLKSYNYLNLNPPQNIQEKLTSTPLLENIGSTEEMKENNKIKKLEKS